MKMKINNIPVVQKKLKDFVETMKSLEVDGRALYLMSELDSSIKDDIRDILVLTIDYQAASKPVEVTVAEEEPAKTPLELHKPIVFTRPKIDPVPPVKKQKEKKAAKEKKPVKEKSVPDEIKKPSVPTSYGDLAEIKKIFDEKPSTYFYTNLNVNVTDEIFKTFPDKNIRRVDILKLFNSMTIKGEEWKPTDYENLEVSDYGRVKLNGKIISRIDNGSAMYVNVRNTSQKQVAKLVLKAFLPEETPEHSEVYTIEYADGNYANCSIGNISWKSRASIGKKKKADTEVEVEAPKKSETEERVDAALANVDAFESLKITKDLNFAVEIFTTKRERKERLSTEETIVPILEFIKGDDNNIRSIAEIQKLIHRKYGKLYISSDLINKIRNKSVHKDVCDLVF